MILGIGSDLCDIRRIEQTLQRFDRRFVERVFTEPEQRHCEALPPALRAAGYAKRFAAKEACAKALGTGIAAGVFLSDIGVTNGPAGEPLLHLVGAAARRLRGLCPTGMRPTVHLSMSDEPPLAQAVVVISAEIAGNPLDRRAGGWFARASLRRGRQGYYSV